MRRAAALLAGLALGFSAGARAEGTWTYATELAAGHDSNAGNAGERHDMQDSGFLYAGISASWERRLGSYTALQQRYSVALEQWADLDELSSERISGRVRVVHKPGRRFYTPILAGWLGAGAREAVSDIRSGFDYRAGLSATEPLTTTIVARVEATHLRRVATSGRVYDLDSSSLGLNLDWQVLPRLVVYGGWRRDDGDFVVSADGHGEIDPKKQHLYLEPEAEAIEADPAFGKDWWAFRVNGRTDVATLGANVALTPGLALDVQLQRGEAVMGKFTYDRNVASVGLLARW